LVGIGAALAGALQLACVGECGRVGGARVFERVDGGVHSRCGIQLDDEKARRDYCRREPSFDIWGLFFGRGKAGKRRGQTELV